MSTQKHAAMRLPAIRDQGFTLIELLVAAGLTALLAGLGLLVSTQMSIAWLRSSGSLSARAQARVIFDQLTLDLQSSWYRDDGKAWLVATVLDDSGNSGLWQSGFREKPDAANGSLRLDAPALEDSRFGRAGVWLRFFATAKNAGDPSAIGGETDWTAPTAIAYQLIRHSTGNRSAATDRKYLLYRTVVRPGELDSRPGTLEAGFDLDPQLPDSAYARLAANNDGTYPGDPFQLRHPDSASCVLAENIVDFGVRFHRWLPDGELERIFPRDGNDLEHVARTPASGAEAKNSFPQVVDVMIRVLTEDGARRLDALEAGAGRLGLRPAQYPTDAEWWWGLVEANSEVFTRRIVLRLPES